MKTLINDVNINYINYGNSANDTIVLLHGWGQNIQMMKPIGDNFQKDFNIIIIDLPGYGESEEPPFPWEVTDYVKMLNDLLNQLKVKNPILIGHSFGGKISLLYASRYNVKKLILFGSPFKNSKKTESLKVKILKFAKKIPIINKLENFAKKRIGSSDYKKASETMRKVLVNTINLNIKEEVKKINAPTILIWGSQDAAVPVEDAYELEKLIPDAAAIVYEGCTHYAYLERLSQTISIIRNFIS